MTEMRRTILWVVFTMSLVLLWDGWQKSNGHPSMFSPAPAKPVAAASAPASAVAPAGTLPTSTVAAAAATPVSAASAATAPVSQRVEIQTDVVRATLDSQGGSLVRVELLKHRDDKHPSGHVVVMDRHLAQQYVAESGLIGVPGAPNHFSTMTLVDGPRQLQDGQDRLAVRFESPVSGGLKLVKTYTFKRNDYTIDVKHEVVNESAAPLTPQLYVQLVRDHRNKGQSSYTQPTTYDGPAIYTDSGKFQKVDYEKVEKGTATYDKQAADGWVAMVQHHFVGAWLRNTAGAREFFVKKGDNGLFSAGMVFPLSAIAPGATATAEDQLYVGPQDENQLAKVAPGLERVKDYGMFHVLASPLFWLLDKLHSLLGNWGWSIIALVVLLKVAFYSLNASAYRSMAKMKAVAPRLQALRERYKDDPQKQQQEMMRIYREEKVNPLGSCLPMLLQMPFFLALYWVLQSSVEMRHAPWIGWITDLASPDPWYILPALMTASSLLQVWVSPAPADPMQQKMMWIMPLAFSFMFFFFPSGLVLYWLVNNLLSIAQQWAINKQMGVQN